MRIGPLEIRIRPRLKIVVAPQLTEAELAAAFGQVNDKHPMLLAINQLIDTAERDAGRLAASQLATNNALLVAGYTGAAEHMRDLRSEVLRYRETGIKDLRRTVAGIRHRIAQENPGKD